MSIQIRTVILICVLALILGLMNMVRRKKLDLKYAFPWLFLGVGVGVFAVFDSFTSRLAVLLGIEVPSNMIFFLGFCFSLTIIFCLTFSVSRLSYKVKRLTQECALMEKRLEELEREGKSAGRERGGFCGDAESGSPERVESAGQESAEVCGGAKNIGSEKAAGRECAGACGNAESRSPETEKPAAQRKLETPECGNAKERPQEAPKTGGKAHE